MIHRTPLIVLMFILTGCMLQANFVTVEPSTQEAQATQTALVTLDTTFMKALTATVAALLHSATPTPSATTQPSAVPQVPSFHGRATPTFTLTPTATPTLTPSPTATFTPEVPTGDLPDLLISGSYTRMMDYVGGCVDEYKP